MDRDTRRQSFIELLAQYKKGESRMTQTAKKFTEEKARKLLEQIQCYASAKGYTQGRMAGMLGIAASSYNLLLHSQYSGDEDTHLTRVEQFLDREAERADRPSLTTFVETSVAIDIFKMLRQNHVNGTMGAIIGNSGVGKTRAFQEYALRNAGVILITASTWMRSHVQLSRKLADILVRGKKPRGTQERCEAIVDELLGASRLLVVDQAHQLREDAHEFLQNLWDQCNPTEEERRLGIVMGCTWRFWNQIHQPKALYWYEQLTSRMDAGFNKRIDQAHPFSLSDVKKLFSSENLRFSLSDAAYSHLLRIANGPGGLRTAVANVDHLQDVLVRQKAPASTEMSVDMLQKTQQLMLRRAA